MQTFELVSENPVSGWVIVSATLKGQCIYATSAHLDGSMGLFQIVALGMKIYKISQRELIKAAIKKLHIDRSQNT